MSAERVAYDEFGLFHENLAEYSIAAPSSIEVRRTDVALPDARHVSTLVWGDGPAEVVFVHGGAQNAHTWDTTILALGAAIGRPVAAVAVDLPGHGHSSWRDDAVYPPASLAADVAVAAETFLHGPVLVVGMSLGGLTSMELTAARPDLVRSLVMVDITPGVNRAKTKAVIDFVDGPQSFPSFESLLARTIEHNPTRTESSLRRGILHNAKQLDDGSWQWRYDRGSHRRAEGADGPLPPDDASAMSPMWDTFGSITCPVTLVRGALSPVVDDDDVAEARRRQPTLDVVVVDGAGHSVQGDRPLELAALLAPLLG
jgi:pimeloyl-ACP methyl ester carboxylesterase